MSELPRIAVVGAGVIGASVAHALAERGHAVVLVDRDAAAIERASGSIRAGARLARLQHRSAAAPAELLARVRFTLALADVAGASVVIENVTEDLEIKLGVHRELDAICAADCVFAANTSAIPIAQLAAATGHPERVVGLHFMNPVPLTAMVEVVRGAQTSEATLARVAALLAAMGKDFVVVNDAPGFVINRVLMPAISEAIAVVHEGTATAAEVDRLFQSCLGHPMGPLRTADLIGLDTVLKTLEVLHENLGGGRAPCPLLREMVAAGRLGRKSGEGFFLYDPGLQHG
ncbi:MAG: 3-hydroxyacyl-CoA dehydrogenase family protein [Byssovorax sp.]